MTLLRRSLLSGLAAVTLFLVACAGSQPSAETTPAEAPDAGEEEASSEGSLPSSDERLAFDDMSMKEQRDYMKEVVVPAMAKTFAGFDADEFDEVNCTTCHGPAARSGDFEMPTKSLPALDAEEIEEHPEWTRFMKEEVTPQMAQLLGEPVYNPETHTGFGCYDCHTKK